MTFKTRNRVIIASARVIANNPKLKPKDILEWSNREAVIKKNVRPGEVYFFVSEAGVWVIIAAANDHRRPIPVGTLSTASQNRSEPA